MHSIGRVLHCPIVVPCAAVGLLLASPARAHDRLDLLIARATRALANRGTGARLHVEVDGADKTGTLSVPDTGGWQAWPTITKSGISLTAGSHAVRLVFDTATALYGGVGNYNSLSFATAASLPYGGTAAALPGTLQMENFDEGGAGVSYYDTTAGNTGGTYRNTNVDIGVTTDTGGGYMSDGRAPASGSSTP